MRFLIATLLLVLTVPAIRAEADAAPEKTDTRYFVGFGAGPQSGHGLHLGLARGPHAADLGLGLIYDGQNAKWGYSTGLRYLRTLYAGRVNDTYAWGGGAITGNYRDQTASNVVSAGAGLGLSFHFGLPIHVNFDSGLAGYFEKKFAKREYYPAFNAAILYEW